MKILMQNRIDAFDKPGGDTEQMLKTREHLIELGLSVDISLEYEPDLANYDLVHLFNTTRIHETFVQFKNAKKQGKPVVLSPIYHNYDEYNKYYGGRLRGLLYRSFSKDVAELVKELIRGVVKYPKQLKIIHNLVWPGYTAAQKEVICGVDCLLPQSHMDIEEEARTLSINIDKLTYFKVVNGVNFEKFDETDFQDVYPELKKDSFIFCAARIEPVKNQLRLVRSLKTTGLKLVLAGSINKYHKAYARQVLSELELIGGTYLGFVTFEELVNLYRKAKVHVLPSWFETCGISSLEAAYAGCNVVSTNRGYAKEYLLNYAWFCDPADDNSIRQSVLEAFQSPRKKGIAKFIRDNYSWRKAAEVTYKAYKYVLNAKNQKRNTQAFLKKKKESFLPVLFDT